MPFKKSETKRQQPPTDARNIFIGRVNELHFFIEGILKPEDPAHNIISIWGQGGVGKSTLLTRFIEEAQGLNFKDYCLTALVDERQATPASIMEKFADQLNLTGEFEKALSRYKESLRKLQSERETARETVWRKTTTELAGSMVKRVPVVGDMLEQGAGLAVGYLWDEFHYHHLLKDAERLENPIADLTEAFVEELNALADSQAFLSADRIKRKRRVILFFDTFEQLATEAAPWLLDYFLEADINRNVVLVVAGRSPLERTVPGDPKRWLPYLTDDTIYQVSLESFTEDETQAYLSKRGITEAIRITTIWQLSRGLPLYLGLLTSNVQGTIDPTANVVANFLRWIPEEEHSKRKLVLDAALLSRPFNQDELKAFTYLSEQERSLLYTWLISQPFVRSNPQDGRYNYHELARELFSRHLYQISPSAYRATRSALAKHYRELLTAIETEEGMEVYGSIQWLELTLALANQLFLLPDEASHIKAIEQILNAYEHTEPTGEIVKLLRDLSQEQPSTQVNANALQIIIRLLRYIEADLVSQPHELLRAADFLLEKIAREPSFSPETLARIYCKRGGIYGHLNEYQQAISDFNHALKLDPIYARAYGLRGETYRRLNEYKKAIQDFDLAIVLDPKLDWTYAIRGQVYTSFRDYQRTISNFDHTIELKTKHAWVYVARGQAYFSLKDYQQAIWNFDRAIGLDLKYVWAYVIRGQAYCSLKEYQQAIEDLNHALELDSTYTPAYVNRGLAHLLLKDIEQASSDYTRSWELDQTDLLAGWRSLWCEMCQGRANLETVARLETIASISPQHYVAYVCRGVAMLLQNRFEEALTELEQAILLDHALWDAYFWKAMVCFYEGQDEVAMTFTEKALTLELPPVLLTPLHWLAKERLNFHERDIISLLAYYS